MTPVLRAIHLKADFGEQAIKVVDIIIETLDNFGYDGAMYDDFETGKITTTDDSDPCEYWRQVKTHLI